MFYVPFYDLYSSILVYHFPRLQICWERMCLHSYKGWWLFHIVLHSSICSVGIPFFTFRCTMFNVPLYNLCSLTLVSHFPRLQLRKIVFWPICSVVTCISIVWLSLSFKMNSDWNTCFIILYDQSVLILRKGIFILLGFWTVREGLSWPWAFGAGQLSYDEV